MNGIYWYIEKLEQKVKEKGLPWYKFDWED